MREQIALMRTRDELHAAVLRRSVLQWYPEADLVVSEIGVCTIGFVLMPGSGSSTSRRLQDHVFKRLCGLRTQQLPGNLVSPHPAIQGTQLRGKILWIDESRLGLRVGIVIVPEHVVLGPFGSANPAAEQVVDDATYFLKFDRIAKIEKTQKSVLFELIPEFCAEHDKTPGTIWAVDTPVGAFSVRPAHPDARHPAFVFEQDAVGFAFFDADGEIEVKLAQRPVTNLQLAAAHTIDARATRQVDACAQVILGFIAQLEGDGYLVAWPPCRRDADAFGHEVVGLRIQVGAQVTPAIEIQRDLVRRLPLEQQIADGPCEAALADIGKSH